MKYAEMQSGMYIVRTRELSWARALSGTILYVCGTQDGSLVVQNTDDCVPKGKKMAIGPSGDDGNWHDATDLVLEANSAIIPPTNEVAYTSAVAANYRNFLGLTDVPCVSGEDAQGEICVLGEQQASGVVFSKSGYYVVAHDKGWYIVYQGFCDYTPNGGQPQTTLRILRLSSNRRFYKAKPIVDACEAAFREDAVAAETYANSIVVETSDTAPDIFTGRSGPAVSRMELGV